MEIQALSSKVKMLNKRIQTAIWFGVFGYLGASLFMFDFFHLASFTTLLVTLILGFIFGYRILLLKPGEVRKVLKLAVVGGLLTVLLVMISAFIEIALLACYYSTDATCLELLAGFSILIINAMILAVFVSIYAVIISIIASLLLYWWVSQVD